MMYAVDRLILDLGIFALIDEKQYSLNLLNLCLHHFRCGVVLQQWINICKHVCYLSNNVLSFYFIKCHQIL